MAKHRVSQIGRGHVDSRAGICAEAPSPVPGCLRDTNLSNRRHADKAQLRATILVLRVQGLIYRQIAREIGLHWTRVQQIVNKAKHP